MAECELLTEPKQTDMYNDNSLNDYYVIVELADLIVFIVMFCFILMRIIRVVNDVSFSACVRLTVKMYNYIIIFVPANTSS